MRGLRIRLVVAFVLVAAFAALATATLTYREARSTLLQHSQDRAVNDLRDRVEDIAPSVSFPPDQTALDLLAARVDGPEANRHWTVVAIYKDLWSTTGPLLTTVGIPGLLRDSVDQGVTAFQRVRADGQVYLAVGVPITFANRDDGFALSGVQVYLITSMEPELRDEAALVRAARSGAVPAVLLALVPAMLAATGVLHPVRALQHATRSLAAGRLDTRLKVKGKDELAELAQDFNHTAAALEKNVDRLQTMEARARGFAADVSHELRTPLAAMAAVTDILDEDATAEHLDPDTAAALRLIGAETGKLVTLVEDLMEISRFDAGAAVLHVDELDLAEAIRRSLDIRGWGEIVTLDVPAWLRAELDPRRLDVVLANLVGNALRHGRPPVEIRLTAERRADGDWIVLHVRDHGPGLPAESLDRVFERFYKADTARTRSVGSGLGMAITRENVLLHGGRIHAANAPGGGALFTVELPAKVKMRADAKPPAGADMPAATDSPRHSRSGEDTSS
nr:ATP-binding protein [Streptomyces sp. SID3343]